MREHAFLRAVSLLSERIPDADAYPWSLPVVRGLTTLNLDSPITFFVGENGAGKSTLVEAIAVALAVNAEGGSQHMYFLRAESFFNVATQVDENPDALTGHGGRSLHEQSHGESFLALIANRFGPDGLYVLDEPEAAMSPQGLLAVLRHLHQLVQAGSQFVIATHSPILLAYPGAAIYEISEAGIRSVAYEETEHYRLTRAFLEAPQGFLRHLLSDE